MEVHLVATHPVRLGLGVRKPIEDGNRAPFDGVLERTSFDDGAYVGQVAQVFAACGGHLRVKRPQAAALDLDKPQFPAGDTQTLERFANNIAAGACVNERPEDHVAACTRRRIEIQNTHRFLRKRLTLF